MTHDQKTTRVRIALIATLALIAIAAFWMFLLELARPAPGTRAPQPATIETAIAMDRKAGEPC